MTIKDSGRWKSLETVQRYAWSVKFKDSLKFYKAPSGLDFGQVFEPRADPHLHSQVFDASLPERVADFFKAA